MKHKQYINEWKSVNDDVKKLADLIISMFWYLSQNDKPLFDKTIMKEFIMGKFKIDLNEYFKNENKFGIDVINVEYCIYFFKDEDDYFRHREKIKNSQYNVDTKTLSINSFLIDGELSQNAIREVYHELNHSFEYGNGLNINYDFYENVKRITEGDASDISVAIGFMIYYTFPYEQDSFANEFYACLNESEFEGSFEEALFQYDKYQNFNHFKRIYKSNYKKSKREIDFYFNYLGISEEWFDRRIDYGYRRFIKKLNRVYQRHMHEMTQKKLTIEQRMMVDEAIHSAFLKSRKTYKDIEYADDYDF